MKKTFLRVVIFSILLLLSVTFVTPGVSAADDKDTIIFDDYNRQELGVTGDGGAYNAPNSVGIAIYWIQMANAKAQVENNILKLSINKNGWFGEGVAFKDPKYKYIIMKIKGEKGGEQKFLSINPDAKGLKKFTQLKGPNGKPIPAITKDFQNIVIDIDKSGMDLPGGFEAIHFNNTAALTVYIDEIYLSKTGVPVDLSKLLAAQGEKGADAAGNSSTDAGTAAISSDAAGAESSSAEITATATNEVASASMITDNTSGSIEKGFSPGSKTTRISLIILVMAILIIAVIYNSFIRKPAADR